MKKSLFAIFVLLSLTGCNNDEIISLERSDVQQSSVNRRSFSEVVEIAKNSILMLPGEHTVTRSTNSCRTLNLSTGIKAFCQPVTRSANGLNGSDTLLYVLNFNDDQGFVVVSASRGTDGLIAVTEKGNYDPNIPTGNPGFDSYMNMAKAYVEYKDREAMKTESPQTHAVSNQWRMYKEIYDTVVYYKAEPKLSVRWGQSGIMGRYCPNNLSGCSNTAAAQIMSFFKYPNSIKLSFEGKDVEQTVLSWNAICNLINTDYLSDAEPAKQLGRLVRQLGQNAGSSYNGGGTETNRVKIRGCLSNLGYNVGNLKDYNQWNERTGIDSKAGFSLGPLLRNGKLIWMRGSNDSNEGHAWVVD